MDGVVPPLGHPLSSGTVRLVGALANGMKGDCTGVLIDRDLLLTAAHCIPSYVVSGEVEFLPMISGVFPKDFYRRTVLNWRLHPEFKDGETEESYNNDIALVRFEGEIPAGNRPFLLPGATLNRGASLMIAGFGSIGVGNEVGRGVFRVATYPEGSLLPNTNEFIISVDQPKIGICGGDSGGPLLVDQGQGLQVIGIVSTTSNVTPDNRPLPEDSCHGVANFVSVYPKLDWISEAGKELRLEKNREQP